MTKPDVCFFTAPGGNADITRIVQALYEYAAQVPTCNECSLVASPRLVG